MRPRLLSVHHWPPQVAVDLDDDALVVYVAVDTCPGPRVGGTFVLLCLPFETIIPKFNPSRNRVVAQSLIGRPAPPVADRPNDNREL
jgi:hypothetical protein